MIHWELLIGFLKVGCFSFGGAYGDIPLIRETVLSYGWLSEEALTDMIAVSESTPGPIMVNLATYVGSSQAGILGALTATLAVAFPSFAVILLVMVLLKEALKSPCVQAVLGGLKPCVIGIILATGCFLMYKNSVQPLLQDPADIRPILMTGILILLYFGTRKVMKKGLPPIGLILISACLGVALYGV